MFESGYLTCDNPEDMVNLKLKATNYNTKGLRNYMNLKINAKDNQIQTQIGWANNKERLFKADLSASTFFIEEKQRKRIGQIANGNLAAREPADIERLHLAYRPFGYNPCGR